MNEALRAGAKVNHRYKEKDGRTAQLLLVEADGCGPAMELILAEPDVISKPRIIKNILPFI